MALQGFADLGLEQLPMVRVFGGGLAHGQAVVKGQGLGGNVNFGDDVALAVFVPPGFLVEIIAGLERQVVFFDILARADIGANGGGDFVAGALDRLQGQQAVIVVVLLLDAPHFNALDQAALKGVKRGQAVNQVVRSAVGGAVVQGKQRLQGAKRGFGGLAFHVLRFVENEKGPHVLQELVGLALAGEFVRGFVEDVALFVEGVYGHDQNHGGGAGGKVAQLAQLAAVIGQQLHGFVVEQGAEVVAGLFEGGNDAFVNGDAGHDNDEFGKAVALAQFVDGAEIDVGFAGAGFHFDSEDRIAPVVGAGPFQHRTFIDSQLSIGGKAVLLLQFGQIVGDQVFIQGRPVIGRDVGNQFIAQGECTGTGGLAVKQGHGISHGGQLKVLFVVKLQAHGRVPAQRTVNLQRSASCCRNWSVRALSRQINLSSA